MMKKLLQSLREKAETALLLLSLNNNYFWYTLLFLALLFLPFQFGKHFWPSFAYVAGRRIDYLSPTIYVSDLSIMLLIITAFLEKRIRFEKKMLTKLMGAALFLSIGIFFSANPLSGWYGLLKIIELALFCWIIASEKSVIEALIFWTFLIGVLTEGALEVLQLMRQSSIGGWWYFLGERTYSSTTPGIANASIHGQLFLRPYATFSHPNVLAGYLVIVFLFFLTHIPFAKNCMQKIVALLMSALGVVLLVGTLSRVASLVFVVVSFVYFQAMFPKKRVWISVFYFLLPLFYLFRSTPVVGRFLDIGSYAEPLVLRNMLLQSAWSMLMSHPFFGVGLANFLVALPSYSPKTLQFGFLQPVHNIFLFVLAETGIVGFSIFIWILYKAFYTSFTKWRENRNPLFLFSFLSLLAICLIGFTDHYFLTLPQGQLLLALVLGISFRHIQSRAKT